VAVRFAMRTLEFVNVHREIREVLDHRMDRVLLMVIAEDLKFVRMESVDDLRETLVVPEVVADRVDLVDAVEDDHVFWRNTM